jgi:hypothetical protein
MASFVFQKALDQSLQIKQKKGITALAGRHIMKRRVFGIEREKNESSDTVATEGKTGRRSQRKKERKN